MTGADDYLERGGNPPLARALATMAGHIATLRERGSWSGCGISVASYFPDYPADCSKMAVHIAFRFEQKDEVVWDTCYFRVAYGSDPPGEEYSVGNRCGATNELAALYAPIIAEIARLQAAMPKTS